MTYARRSQVIAGAVALAVLAVAFWSGRPQAAVTLTPETVVARLGNGPAISDGLRRAILAQRAAPDDLPTAISTARLMLDEGRAKGDGRLVGAALGMVQPFVDAQAPAAQFIAAQARQYQHDFPQRRRM
jgi:hypothetical protein